ncbi:MAG: aminopeptidase P family protein [Geminicoccaceae bacterium]|nr:aminopeptidase P family protein [Geminicoccaceae bacterium]
MATAVPPDLGRPPAEVDRLLRGLNASAVEGESWLALFGDALSPQSRDWLIERRRTLAEAAPLPPVAERLRLVRAELARQGVDGFVLPRTDQYGSEYLPPGEERLAWLTGFTGSAGQAIILSERAAIFVDGRYTVQAGQEVDEDLFETVHLVDHPPARWLEEALAEGQAVGYDPALHTKAGIERLKKAAARRGAVLKPLADDPIDAVWAGRPPAPIAPIALLDEARAGESSAAKRARIAAEVVKEGADRLLVTAADGIAWLLNVRGADIPFNPLTLSHLLLDADGRARWFVDPAKLPPSLVLDDAVEPLPPSALAPTLDGLGGARVLVDPARVHAVFAERLEAAGATLVAADDPIVPAKAIKNPVEVQGARDAQARDGVALCRFLAWLDANAPSDGLDEIEAAARLETFRAGHPLFRGPSFPTISAHGPNAALPHYRTNPASNRALTDGVYLVDSGAQYPDGTTDVTRTVAIGTSEPDATRCFTLVLKGHVALARQRFPTGTTGGQLDALARMALWGAGLDFDHGTGHGIGSYLCVHEGPQRIAKSGGGVALKPGMIVSNEPGYYRAGAFGIRIENLLLVTEDSHDGDERPMLGFETLTLAPIDRRLIDAALLDPGEQGWLDAYHARVLRELGPCLEGADAAWLAAACRPLAA